MLSQVRFSTETSIAFASGSSDKQMFYAVPWENNCVLIGVTDTEFSGNPDDIEVSDNEIEYLLKGRSEEHTSELQSH